MKNTFAVPITSEFHVITSLKSLLSCKLNYIKSKKLMLKERGQTVLTLGETYETNRILPTKIDPLRPHSGKTGDTDNIVYH